MPPCRSQNHVTFTRSPNVQREKSETPSASAASHCQPPRNSTPHSNSTAPQITPFRIATMCHEAATEITDTAIFADFPACLPGWEGDFSSPLPLTPPAAHVRT